MTNQEKLVEYLNTGIAKQLRAEAQELKLPGAWKARKSELVDMLTKYFLEALEQVHGLDEYERVLEKFAEIELDVTGDVGLPEVEPEQIPVTGLEQDQEPEQDQEVPEGKRINKKAKDYVISSKLSEEDVVAIEEQGRLTASSCSDPNRLVVKRSYLSEFIESRTGQTVTSATFNQLVVMAANKLPRQHMTINSASRFKYLLLENKSALWVTDWILNNTQQIEIAANLAEIAAEEGYRIKMASK